MNCACLFAMYCVNLFWHQQVCNRHIQVLFLLNISVTAQEEEVYQDCFLLKILVILALRGHLTTREGSVLPGRAERASFFPFFGDRRAECAETTLKTLEPSCTSVSHSLSLL